MDAIAALGRALNASRAADEDLRSVDDGHGEPMFQVEGIAQAQADDFKQILEELSSNLGEYVFNWRVAQRVREQSGSEGPSL